MANTSPPKFPLKVLKWFCKPEYHVDIEGDLLELYERRLVNAGSRNAKLHLLKDVLLLCRPGIIRAFKLTQNLNHASMLRHNLTLSLRSFLRHKTSFLINLLGLSTGITSVLLICLWVTDELSMDKFHEKDGQLYKVMLNVKTPQNIQTWSRTPVPLAEALIQEMPEVESAVGVNDFFSWQSREGIISVGHKTMQAKGWHAGTDFFNVFSYDLIHGNKNQVLNNKSNIVISEKIAQNLFDTVDGALGKTVEWKHPLFQGTYYVSGIFKSPPSTSTAQFDFLISMDVLLDNDRWAKQWTGNYAETYVILKKGTNISEFNDKIDDFLKTKDALNDKFTLFTQQYSSIYLNAHYENGKPDGGRIVYVKLFSIVALFVLLIACINFMNLSTAKASLKMKEIGVKKTVGASQSTLVFRFLSESLLLTFLSLFIAVPVVALLLPSFNELTGKQLTIVPQPARIIAISGIVLLTGFIAGSYPAFYLSSFNPIAVLKGKIKTSYGPLLVRKVLVVFQFALSILFIVGLMVVNEQIKFTQTKNLGYNRDNILCFQWKGELFNNWNGLLEGKSNKKFETFMEQLNNIPGVVNATNISGNILNEIYGQSGISWSGQDTDEDYIFKSPIVGLGFIETLGIELKEGRSFSREFNDDYSKIIINEAAVRLMGLKEPVGKIIQMNGGSQIVGVVKDFHYGSLHNAIEPLIFRFDPTGRNVMIKIKTGSEQDVIKRIKKFYDEFLPAYAFEFTFLDDDYQALYKSESRVAVLSQYFSVIAIILSCLGLLGLATFTAERRLKEIGIRKILGSSEFGIIRILTGEFTNPVLMAIVISLPVSYLLARSWLNSFSDRIELSSWVFIFAGLAPLFITWLTVGLQTIKAARINPVHYLRNE
jgi:putative ABC transport system permease protein